MIRFAIVEDDPDCQRTIVSYIHDFFDGRDEVDCTVFDDGADFLAARRDDFDIIFLDIMMPKSNGIDVARTIRQNDPKVVIIFVTEATQYALDGYGVAATDFLVKPLFRTSFNTAMERALALVERRQATMLQVNFDKTTSYVNIGSIFYIETKNKAALIHAQSGDYMCSDTMRELETKLGPFGFGRCHQAYIVNTAYVESVTKTDVLVRGERIPLSRNRREEFVALLLREVGSTL